MYQYRNPRAWEHHLSEYESSDVDTEDTISSLYGRQSPSRNSTIQSQYLNNLPEDVSEKLKEISTTYLRSRQNTYKELSEKAESHKSENLRKEELKRVVNEDLDNAEMEEQLTNQTQRREMNLLIESLSADDAEEAVSAWRKIFNGIKAFLKSAKEAIFAALRSIMRFIAMAWEGLMVAVQVVKGFFVSAWTVVKGFFGSCDDSDDSDDE